MSVLLPLLVFGPMAGGVCSYLIGRKHKKARDWFAFVVTALTFAVMVAVLASSISGKVIEFSSQSFSGLGLSMRADGFRALYGVITAFMWMMTSLFSQEYFAHYRNRNRYWLFNLLTLGATMGVFLSADLFTTFLFFEVMSFTSYVLVAHDENTAAMRAAGTYLAVAVIGGLVMLMGIFLLYHMTGTLSHYELYAACKPFVGEGRLYAASVLMLVGFGAKAGMFPFHIWLPKAHPVAPAPASALLSGVLTKSGIFGVALICGTILFHDPKWGLVMLLLGAVTMFLGAFLALFSIDLKRTLACSSVSQIGFILVGMGMQGLLGSHNALAVRGTILHMVNHSLIKLVLFMAAGVVYMNLHELDFNAIRGYGRGKPVLFFVVAMGALGIMGVPMWNGYISKTLLHESIVEYIWTFTDYTPFARLMQGTEYLFVFTGGLTVAYMVKVLVVLFVEKPARDFGKERYMNKKSAFALIVSASVLPVLGIIAAIMNKIADFGQEFLHGHDPEHAVHYFSWINLRGGFSSLVIGGILYCLVVRVILREKGTAGQPVYRNLWPGRLDLEERVYRPLLKGITAVYVFAFRGIDMLPGQLVRLLVWAGGRIMQVAEALPGKLIKVTIGAGCYIMQATEALPGLAVRLLLWAGHHAMTVLEKAFELCVTGLIAAATFISRLLETSIEAGVYFLLKKVLRRNKSGQFPGRFYARYYRLVYPGAGKKKEQAALSESFSYGLLLFGLGLCAVLGYVLYRAFR